tara:strand:+ start:916 stop:1134 length:219 start_codon:yes stop_codon:yes gene_type:complete
MAYLRGVANPRDPKETLVFTHWISVVQLLKAGIPWEAIHTLTENEVSFVFGVLMAIDQKQAEDQQRQMAAAH